MKKLNRFISKILIAVLVCTCCYTSQAKAAVGNDSESQSEEVYIIGQAQDAIDAMPELSIAKTMEDETSTESALYILDKSGNETTTVVPYYFSKASEVTSDNYKLYYAYATLNYGQDVVIPITVKKTGILIYEMQAGYTDVALGSNYTIYSDTACTKKVSGVANEAYISKAGTYYLKVPKAYLSKTGDSSLIFALGFVSNSNVELKHNVEVISSIINASANLYYKVVVGKTAKITATIQSESPLYITLCNSKKTAITDKQYYSSGTGKAFYIVKKGTYYLRVKSKVGFVSAKVLKAAVGNTAGNSKAKAGTVTVNGSSKTILMYAGDSTKTTYYVKFYNKSTRKIYLTLTSNFTSGYAKFQFYNSEGTKFGSLQTLDNGLSKSYSFQPYSADYTSSSKTLPKGTYYLKFTKTSTKTDGMIQLKVSTKAS